MAIVGPDGIRTDWTREEVDRLWQLPLMALVRQAAAVHEAFHDPSEVQVCQLVSIKTGGCPEDCSYCSQSVHNPTAVRAEPLLSREWTWR